MQKRLKNIAHPFLAFIIAAFSLVFECDVWLFTPPKQWWFISVLMLAQALAISCYWSPVWCSVALLLLNGVGEYAISGYAQFTSYFMFLAVILICYKTSNRIAAALCLLMMSYTCLETMIRPGSFTGYGCLAFCMIYAVASTIGRYMAWEQRRMERMRESVMVESRLRQLEANQYLAAYLHDALSQELALISMETQLHAVDKSVPDEERWRRVSDYTQNALATFAASSPNCAATATSKRMATSRRMWWRCCGGRPPQVTGCCMTMDSPARPCWNRHRMQTCIRRNFAAC